MNKPLASILGAALLLGTFAAAEPAFARRGHGRMHGGERLSAALDLTEEQQAAVKQLREELYDDMKPLIEQRHQQKEEIRALLDAGNADATEIGRKTIAAHQTGRQLKALREEFQTKLGALLTPEQREKFDQLQEKRQDRRERHRDFHSGRGRSDKSKGV